jgi:arylsulfatase A
MFRATQYFLVTSGVFGCATAFAEARQPNIVLILADDVGREVLECYGGESYPTPRLNRLANEGVRFDQAHVMPVCHPTRICLLTGQYPFRLGNPDWGTFPRDAEHRTLANLLKQAGYATAVVGKWQLTLLRDDPQHPHRMGFDECCLLGWHEGPWYFEPVVWQNGKRRDDVQGRYGHDIDIEYLADFIRRHRDEPFFAFYSMVLCHAETNDLDHPVPTGPLGRYLSYAEMVAAMDERVGRVVDLIAELGLAEDTVILFTTDNGSPKQTLVNHAGGDYIYEPVVSQFRGRAVPGGKATLTDGGTRVPLIAQGPGRIAPGRVTDDLVDASDLLPTIAEIAGARLPAGATLDGQSFAGRLLRDEPNERQWVFAEHDGKYFVKDRAWKLFNDGRFFNLQHDPDGTTPLDAESLIGESAAAFQRLSRVRKELVGSAQPR